ncbi:MAG: hypothetical protein B7733_18815 [Myxococcales bacterium FL481]|nr:MAG: hypothetical protein B7733_18815 [Myxococcales bacterium FL481]
MDLLTGFLLMNAMPHLLLGVWKARMLSGLGFSPRANSGYGLLNVMGSLAPFTYRYGPSGLGEPGLYSGALIGLLLYFLTAKFFHSLFRAPRAGGG